MSLRTDPPPPPVEENHSTRRHWIIVHEPKHAAEVKGPFALDRVDGFLRQLIECRPEGTSYTVCSLTWDYQLWLDSGRDRVAMTKVARERRHRRRASA